MPGVGKGIGFERIRRITGYLVGTMDKWNDAKKAEESERTKHKIDNRLVDTFPAHHLKTKRSRRKRK